MRLRFEWMMALLALACGGQIAADEGSRGIEGGENPDSDGEPRGSSGGVAGSTASGGVASGGSTAGGSVAAGGGTSSGGKGSLDRGSCEDLRSESLAIYDEKYALASLCDKDSDCILVSFAHNCGSICPAPMNKLMPSVIGEPLYDFADDHCGDCWESYDGACSKPPDTMACLEGKCVFTEPYPEQGKFPN